MKLIISACLSINLVGCASYWDSQDPCQASSRAADYRRPSFCGAGAGGTSYTTRDFYTNNIITTTRSSK
jgi:hypothetical protein